MTPFELTIWLASFAPAVFFLYKWLRCRYWLRVVVAREASLDPPPSDGANDGGNEATNIGDGTNSGGEVVIPLTIPAISLQDIDPIFRPNELGPTLETEVHFLASNLWVVGGTTDLEAWVLAVLSRTRRNIFEFGTCTGKTTYLLARNSPEDARIITLTLSRELASAYRRDPGDSEGAEYHAMQESVFERFLYSGTPQERKVTQLFGDSKEFDETPYLNSCDLIFVDGSHAYSYVRSDTQKALRMVKPGGMVLWHDYRDNERAVEDVVRYLNELAPSLDLRRLDGTSLVAYRHKPVPPDLGPSTS